MARIDESHRIHRRHIYPLGQAASVCDQCLSCITEGPNQLFSLRAFLITIYMEHRKGRQELPDPTSAVCAELFGARNAAMKCNCTLRPSLLDRAFDCDLVGDPFRTDKVALNERNAVLEGEVVDLLTIDHRDHDPVVTYNALSSS